MKHKRITFMVLALVAMITAALPIGLWCGFAAGEKAAMRSEQVQITNTPFLTIGTTNQYLLKMATIPTTKALWIRCDNGEIEIDFKTGHVDLPVGVTLDQAAIEFWKAVAKAFPEVKKQICCEAEHEK